MKRSCKPRPHVLLACVVAVAALMWPVVAHAAWFLPEERLTSQADFQRWPEISGTKVAYEDYRNQHDVGEVDDPTTLFDIRVLNLTTGSSKNLTPYHTAVARPAISGHRVVWEDYGHGTVRGGIYHYNLRTGVRTRLPISSGRNLRISGDRIVYEAFRSGEWRVYIYNLVTRRETRVTADGSSASSPDISGKRVVWMDHRDGNFEIYAYDMTTKVTTRVTNNAASQQFPRISGTKIVWEDDRNGILDNDVYFLDLAGGGERRITDEPERQFRPAIDGNRIVWQDERHGDTEIYLFDLMADSEVRVTNNPAYQGNVTIDGGRIVYEDHLRPGIPSMDLYMTRIVLPKVSIAAPAAVAYGAQATVTGTLTDAGGTGLPGKTVQLEYSSDAATWLGGGTSVTNIDGQFSVLTPALVGRRFVRVRFLGDATFAGAVSGVRTAKTRLEFTDAPASSTYTYAEDSRHRVWGYFRPKHGGGSQQIKIRAYKWQNTSSGWKWVYRQSFTSTVTNPEGSVYSKYTGYVRLPSSGSWQLRAYHADDSRNAATWSSTRDVTVP